MKVLLDENVSPGLVATFWSLGFDATAVRDRGMLGARDPDVLALAVAEDRAIVTANAVDFTALVPSETVTACPYKGRTTGYWSVRAGGTLHADLAWSYDFPTRQLLPITGLVAFYNEKVDITLDGQKLERPRTHFS